MPLLIDDSLLLNDSLKLELQSGSHLMAMKNATGKTLIQKEIYHKFYKNKEKSGARWASDFGGVISSFYTKKIFFLLFMVTMKFCF